MRLVSGLLVFVAAVFFGICGTWVETAVLPFFALPEVKIAYNTSTEPEIAPVPAGVHVLYAGTGKDGPGGESYLKFVIHNGRDEALSYFANTADNPIPRLRVNGGDLPRAFYCTRGASRFVIPPGRSTEVRVYNHEFLTRPPKNVRVSAGFYLRPTGSAVHYSEPFVLPEEFRKSIRED
jgi:hypothetical protein